MFNLLFKLQRSKTPRQYPSGDADADAVDVDAVYSTDAALTDAVYSTDAAGTDAAGTDAAGTDAAGTDAVPFTDAVSGSKFPFPYVHHNLKTILS